MTLNADTARARYRYEANTGRLFHRQRGNGRRMGIPLGDESNGLRRSMLLGKSYQTAHVVWLMHHGEFPSGILRHINGDNLDDRIENLELLKKQLPVAYVHDGKEVNEYGRLPTGIDSGIYEILCVKNGRRYVGSAAKIEGRWRLHYTHLERGVHHSRHLQRAWNKYGETGFVFRVLETCDKASLLVREQHFIDTLKPAFNSRPKADSQLGFRHSEQSRRKMSNSRQKDFSPMTGRSHSPEAKKKISEAKSGRKLGKYDADRIAKARDAMCKSKGALTYEQAKRVKHLKSLGMKHGEVAKMVGCSYWAVADIARGRTFKESR